MVPGRAFLQSVRILTIGLKKPHYKRRMTQQAKLDLMVWLEFLNYHNGVTLYKHQLFLSPGVVNIHTDACINIGLGAVLGKHWFACQWPTEWWRQQNITLLEFIPIVLAVVTWKSILKNKVVIFHTDNLSLVSIINKQHSNEGLVRSVLRGFVLSLLKFNIKANAIHISGKENSKADALSRDLITQFRLLHPLALKEPSETPALPPYLESTGTWTPY